MLKKDLIKIINEIKISIYPFSQIYKILFHSPDLETYAINQAKVSLEVGGIKAAKDVIKFLILAIWANEVQNESKNSRKKTTRSLRSRSNSKNVEI